MRTEDGDYVYEAVLGPRIGGFAPWIDGPGMADFWRERTIVPVPDNPILEPPMYFPGAKWAENQLYA